MKKPIKRIDRWFDAYKGYSPLYDNVETTVRQRRAKSILFMRKSYRVLFKKGSV